MTYTYLEQRPLLFSDDGQRLFLKFRDGAGRLLSRTGAFRLGHLQDYLGRDVQGIYLELQACADRMVELGEIIELRDAPRGTYHYRVFVRPDGYYEEER